MVTKVFTATYRVSIGDINYGGHLGNDRALVIFQDGRLHFLQSLGFSEMDIGKGCGIIMVESGVRYLREVFVHEKLAVSITVAELKSKKFILEYAVVRQEDQEPLFRGFTSFLAFDYTVRKVVPLPEEFRGALAGYLAQ